MIALGVESHLLCPRIKKMTTGCEFKLWLPRGRVQKMANTRKLKLNG